MPKWTQATATVSLSTTTARSSQLTPGEYYVQATAAWFMKQGGDAVEAVAATSLPVQANEKVLVTVGFPADDDTEAFIAGILASGTATMYISPVTP